MKNGVTEYQAIDLSTGERLFYQNLGNQTTNIGEFLGLMAAIKYVIENDFQPRIIYTDSITAITWFKKQEDSIQKEMPRPSKSRDILEGDGLRCFNDRGQALGY